MDDVNNQTTNKQNKTLLYIFSGCLVLFICLFCVAAVTLGGVAYFFYTGEVAVATPVELVEATAVPPTIQPTNEIIPSATPAPAIVETDTPLATTITATAAPTLTLAVPEAINQQPIPARTFGDLDKLMTADYPAHDYFETGNRLGKYGLSARTIDSPAYEVGQTQTFQVDGEAVTAVLMAATEHVYFWVDDRLDFPQNDLNAAAQRLEEDYYPRLINLFGQEWQPGIDNDPHFSILHFSGSADGSELGYFSDTDEYPSQLYSDSNEEEMVYLVMGPLQHGEDLYYGTMVHEVQHLIQWYMDSNEATWLNEGLSQLAEIYVGLETADSYDYLRQPDIRLNTWEYEDDTVDAHYAGAYLYTVYLWEQLGEAAIQELSRHPVNGMAGVQATLQGYDAQRDLVQFTADWAAANYLDDPAAGPRYHYRHLDFGRPDLELRLTEANLDEVKQLNQFGVHYIDLDYRGESSVTFAGDTTVNLIDSPPRSGEQMWFAPPQNDSSLQLTAAFDLSSLDSATLKFSAWYDLEEDYDFAYVAASTDNGQNWDILTPNNSRVGEYGPSLNGRSADRSGSQDGWVKEAISLDSYLGQTVLIRFEVLTDSAVIGQGLALDDISIPELGYQTDVENGPDGWQPNGFVQTGWQIPQQWVVQLIESGPNPTVTRLPLNDLNQAQWPLTIGKGGGVLVITPLTPFAADPAHYWLQIQE
jgi:immune inhibitor A